MAQSGFVSDDDLKILTGAAWAGRQEAWLKAERIPYKRRGPRVTVCWIHVHAYYEGRPPVIDVEPDLSSVH